MLGLMRNLAGIRESQDISPWKLAASYTTLRLGGARVLGRRVANTDHHALVSQFEEIYLRRHYPFRPTGPRPLVIDGGANIGLATLFFKTVAPDARVIAFEPEPIAYRLLEQNVAANHLADVRCLQLALAADDGPATLRLPGWPETEVENVRLSRYITEPVELLKLDIEGAEVDVIEEVAAAGALALVANVAVEYHPGADGLPRLLAALTEAGFAYRIAPTDDRFWSKEQLLLIHAFRANHHADPFTLSFT